MKRSSLRLLLLTRNNQVIQPSYMKEDENGITFIDFVR